MKSRREFLKNASTGAVTLGALSTGARARLGEPRAAVEAATSDSQRRALVAEAHFGPKEVATGRRGIAITSHPLATREAVNVLRSGGNACDAALCASVTQTVVEPHMTGITGNFSLLYHDAASGRTAYVNGTPNVPLGAKVGANGRASDVGVPGFWHAFEAAHERFCSKPKGDLMKAAITYAREGFEIHPFLWGEIFVQCQTLGKTAAGREIFMPNKALPRPGDVLVQKRAAETLQRLREEGLDYYRGDFAKAFCEVSKEAGRNVTVADFEHYQARWQEPAWGSYRGYRVAGSPPPDHGGTMVIEMLNLFELLDLQKLGPPTDSAETLAQMIRMVDLVWSEGHGHGDPEVFPIDLERVVSKELARMRFDLLQMDQPKLRPPKDESHAGSNHVTVADGAGNVATILHTCNALPWSNGLFTEGVTICDIYASGIPGYRKSNYIAPNILFRDDKPFLASGSPSISLIQCILQNTVNIVDFDIPIEESVLRPRFGSRSLGPTGWSDRFLIEADLDSDVREQAAASGIPIEIANPWNWHHGAFEGIHIDPGSGTMRACGDPRRNSKAEAV